MDFDDDVARDLPAPQAAPALDRAEAPARRRARRARPRPRPAPSPAGRKPFSPSVVDGGLGKAPSAPALPVSANDDMAATVPVMGRIAAGTPISAIQHTTHSITVSPDMLGMGAHYALEVKGDSMIEAGIRPGDLVAVQRRATVSEGEIAVAAAIPSILFYFGLFAQIDAYSARRGLRGIPLPELPRLLKTIKDGWLHT